jgi:imidazolonepropionase-like amidohydrolase
MRLSKFISSAALFILLSLVGCDYSYAQEIAVRGETIYTMAGAPIKDGVVLVRGGKIERVGAATQVQIPANYRVLMAKVVTPGLIDARSSVGLSGYLNQPQDQDQLERSSAMQPELRAIDAYNPREKLVEYLRSFGITTLHTGPSAGTLISGQTMIIKTIGEVDSPALLNPSAMIAASIGQAAIGEGGKSPGTRSKAIAMLRAELLKAKEAQGKASSSKDEQKGARDLHMEQIMRVIRGEVPLLVNVQRANDIVSLLRVAREFNIKIVLDGAAESYLVANQIKAMNVPVIIHPTMARNVGEAENMSMETAATLHRAGIPVALQSGFEGYVPKTRVVLFEAAEAAANGLSFTDALATITIDAARILGINNRTGSLEQGKDADLALFDGDPFEFTSHVTGVVIDGKVVSEEKK